MARAPFVLSFLLAGCTVDELSQSYQLDRLRILAVRATPAEPRPGETITLEAYTYDPEDHDLGILWFGCLPDSADEFGCTVDPSVLESLLGIRRKGKVLTFAPLFPEGWTRFRVHYRFEETLHHITVENRGGREATRLTVDGVLQRTAVLELSSDGAEHEVVVECGPAVV